MIISRFKQKNFSRLKKKRKKSDKDLDKEDNSSLNTVAKAGIGAVSVGHIGKLIHDKCSGNLRDMDNRTQVLKNPENLTSKLESRSKDLGIKIVRDNKFDNSAYVGSPGNLKRKLVDIIDKNGDDYLKEKLADSCGIEKKHVGEIGRDTIILGRDDHKSPTILAHEMGHASMTKKGRSKDIVGKGAHLIPRIDTKNKYMKAGLFAAGMRHGVKASKKKKKEILKELKKKN